MALEDLVGGPAGLGQADMFAQPAGRPRVAQVGVGAEDEHRCPRQQRPQLVGDVGVVGVVAEVEEQPGGQQLAVRRQRESHAGGPARRRSRAGESDVRHPRRLRLHGSGAAVLGELCQGWGQLGRVPVDQEGRVDGGQFHKCVVHPP